MVIKNLISQNRLKKFMQVGIDVKCMHTKFGGRALSGFGDTVTFKNGQISLGHQKFNRLESAQKIYASICSCDMHVH